MSSLLVIPTLLDAFSFLKNAPPSWSKRAQEGFVAKIRRERSTMPAWVRKGSKFEDVVYAYLNKTLAVSSDIDTDSKEFQHVASACKGGIFQETCKATIDVNGAEVVLYGKLDVRLPTKIIDIKTTLNFRGVEKYLKGSQHVIYCFCKEVTDFEYIVIEWVGEKGYAISSVYSVPYTVPEHLVGDGLRQQIVDSTQEMFDYLHAHNLYNDYFQLFCKNR